MNNEDWEQFKKTVSPLKNQKRQILKQHKTFKTNQKEKLDKDIELMDIKVSESWGALEKNILRKIQRGKLRVSNSLDLHGSNISDSKKLVFDFVNNNFQNDKRILLIITGKGKRMFVEDKWKGTGILKTKIPIWLTSLALSKKIIWFDHAPSNMGGEGAFIVYLKKLKNKFG